MRDGLCWSGIDVVVAAGAAAPGCIAMFAPGCRCSHVVTDLVLKWSSKTIAWIAGHTRVPGPPPSTLGTCPHSFSSRNANYLSLVWCHKENKKHQDADRNFEKHHN